MRWSLLLIAPACSFGARSAGTTTDAPAGIDVPHADAQLDAPPVSCMDRWMAHTVRFQPPTEMIELNTTGYERDAFLSDDELNIYFSAVRADSLPTGYQDIYTANRSSTSEQFGPVTKFLGASTTTGAEGKMSMTADGTQLFVATNISGSGSKGGTDIWFSSKNAGGWAPLGQGKAGMLNDPGEQLDPIVTPDGTAIYFAPTSGLPQQIWVSTRTDETKNFGAPTELTELADPGGQGTADPAISADQKLIIVTSARTGTTGVSDLWYATRNDPAGPFGALQLVPDINSADYDGDAHLSHDGCRIYFDSTRNNPAAGDWDLFFAQQQL
ncbi:MAG: PD40 domain-containing protein [Deltaproteobacteria bacterium]|nr:PD40 domain-containing protein [Deltaproteobacteria bacterium]